MREKLFEYVANQYGINPDYPFSTAPTYAVLRHPHNNKWFALVVDVPGQKLGLKKLERCDLVNVKLDDPFLLEMLLHQEGYLPAYHMNKEHWISALLDGSVDFDELCQWIDTSYSATN